MARWSRGQDAALSRRNHGFDTRTSCDCFLKQPNPRKYPFSLGKWVFFCGKILHMSWEPQHQETWWLGVYCPQGPPALGPTWDSGPSQNTADNRSLKRVNRRAPCQAGRPPPQSSSGTEGCSASRDGIASHVREAGDKRVSTALLSFSSTSCRCYLAV